MENKNYSSWEVSRVRELFRYIEECKKQNISLIQAFSAYAKQTGKKANSIRNYYYLELAELYKNEKRCKQVGIDLKNHEKQDIMKFTKTEEQELLKYILEQKQKGISVRKSCLALAKNDPSLMIRYQNKFRSLVKRHPELLRAVQNRVDAFSVPKLKTEENILNFTPKIKVREERPKRITDEEIKGLFMGIVNLIKKNANLEINTLLKQEYKEANEHLRKTLIMVEQKQKEISDYKKENKELNSKVYQLENKLRQMRVSLVKSETSKVNKKSKV